MMLMLNEAKILRPGPELWGQGQFLRLRPKIQLWIKSTNWWLPAYGEFI